MALTVLVDFLPAAGIASLHVGFAYGVRGNGVPGKADSVAGKGRRLVVIEEECGDLLVKILVRLDVDVRAYKYLLIQSE